MTKNEKNKSNESSKKGVVQTPSQTSTEAELSAPAKKEPAPKKRGHKR